MGGKPVTRKITQKQLIELLLSQNNVMIAGYKRRIELAYKLADELDKMCDEKTEQAQTMRDTCLTVSVALDCLTLTDDHFKSLEKIILFSECEIKLLEEIES